MKQKMNNLSMISLVLFLILVAYMFYYNMNNIKKTVEGFFDASCDADNDIFADLTEDIQEDSQENTQEDSQEDTQEDTQEDSQEDNELEDLSMEHVHDSLVRKTGIYPMLRDLNLKMDKKCPEMPDMSKYVLKSSIKPQEKCPDMSNYVLKTNILPEKKCPDCVCPKVNVTAGLCKKCEPCPACPPPKRCPRPT